MEILNKVREWTKRNVLLTMVILWAIYFIVAIFRIIALHNTDHHIEKLEYNLKTYQEHVTYTLCGDIWAEVYTLKLQRVIKLQEVQNLEVEMAVANHRNEYQFVKTATGSIQDDINNAKTEVFIIEKKSLEKRASISECDIRPRNSNVE